MAVGVTPQAVSKWERGQARPDILLLSKVADYLACSIDDLLRADQSNTDAEEPAAVVNALDASWAQPTCVPVTIEEQRDAAVLAQCNCLQALCAECICEGDCELELGNYDRALLAYTRCLRSLETFLILGEEGISAYPWNFMPDMHWKLYLRRAVCYQSILRSDDCEREIGLAKEIVDWLSEAIEDVGAFAQAMEEEIRRLGLHC